MRRSFSHGLACRNERTRSCTPVAVYDAVGRVNETQQTGKTVHEGLDNTGVVKEQTTFTYNRQGRLATVEIDQDVDSNPGIDTTTDYEYSDSGIRVSQSVNGTKTLYLIDANNHTGYQCPRREPQVRLTQFLLASGFKPIIRRIAGSLASHQGRLWCLVL